MGLLKWIFKHFKCKSACAFNGDDEVFDSNILNSRMSEYELKHKDIIRIQTILNKRTKTIRIGKEIKHIVEEEV